MEIKKNITEVNRTVKQSREIKYIVVHYTGNKGDTAYKVKNAYSARCGYPF